MKKKDNSSVLPVIFLHIQKTAGSSIIELVREHYGKSLISHGDYEGHRPEEFLDIGFVSGHFGYEYARPLMADRYSFTFLRDPVDRVLSFYYFCKSRNPNELEMYSLAHKLNLEEFLKHALMKNLLSTAVCNNQTWQLAKGYGHGTNRGYYKLKEQEKLDLAINHLEKFSHVGFTETFEEDRNIILNKIGIPLPENNEITNTSGGRLSVEDLPDSTVELLREVTSLDQVVYDQAWDSRYS